MKIISSRILIICTFAGFCEVKEPAPEEVRKAEHGGSLLQRKVANWKFVFTLSSCGVTGI